MQAALPLPWRRLFQRNSVSLARGGDGERPEPVIVYRAANGFEADVVVGRLAAEGIPTWRRSESLGAAYGLLVGPLAQVDILVPATLADKARALLASDSDDEDGEDHRRPTTDDR